MFCGSFPIVYIFKMADFRSDHNLVRDYVTAADHLQYSQLPEDMVAVLVTHSNLSAKHLDIRFNLHTTVAILFILKTHLVHLILLH